MTDRNAMDFIEASKPLGSRLGLERISRLCALLGDPQDGVPAVHVAGTNGKGSVSAMLASVLTAAGCKTGLYQSPYLDDVRECIRIDGEPMPPEAFEAAAPDVCRAAERMAGEGDPPTAFELETAVAFLWFQREGCGAMVVETGLGGRLDATNVIRGPLVSVITSISLDHTAILGDTVARIAYEKCGILKPGGAAVCYPVQAGEAWAVIHERADAAQNALVVPDMIGLRVLGSDLDGTDIEYRGMPLHIPLVGRHQVLNAVTAVEAALALRERRGFGIADGHIAGGIRHAALPLRQEVIRGDPLVLLDGAHNPEGLAALADTVKTLLAGRRLAVVMGMLADKAYDEGIGLVAPLCGRFIACRPENPRALPSVRAAEVARRHCREVSVNDDAAGALAEAARYAGHDGAVVACGSLYLAGPVRKLLIPK